MDVKSEQINNLDNDSDSVIYVSDNSVASISEIETRNGSIESIVLDTTSEEEEDTDNDTNDGDVVLWEEKFTISEAVEEMQEEVIKQYEDKVTQTYDKEFPSKFPNRTATTANTLDANLTSGSVPPASTSAISTSTTAANQSDRNNQNFNGKNSVRERSPVRNNVLQTRRTYSHTKSYSNRRFQPYRRYNNNYNNNYNRPNYRNYDNNYNRNKNNYYNRNYNNGYNRNYNNHYNRNYNNGYNRFETARHNNNYRYNHYHNVQRYGNQFFTNQFKDRLFTAFINLMDYVFDYDYSRDIHY